MRYTEAEVEDELKKWEVGVVGYVMGVNPSLQQMRTFVARI